VAQKSRLNKGRRSLGMDAYDRWIIGVPKENLGHYNDPPPPDFR
jgi:hypothetical protein